MTKLTKIQEFAIFCMEAYKTKYKLSGTEILNIFQKYNVFNFLESSYDLLHTQSMDYIVSEIYEYINNRK